MKKIIVTSLILIGCIVTSHTQPCFPDGLTLTSQVEIDSFQVNYPNCTEIEGNLILEKFIENLDGLSHLTSIGGNLAIRWNGYLLSITGLSGLTSIGGSLSVHNNNFLTSLSGLENIDPESISSINISYNPDLTECDLQSLCDYLLSPNGKVDIFYNDMGCNNPGEIASQCGNTMPCLPYGNYHFWHQYEIDSFYYYFPECNNLEGTVLFHGDDILSLEPLIGLSSVSEYLYFEWTKYLLNFNGLDSLSYISGALLVDGNDAIENFEGLEKLTTVGGIQIDRNSSLINFTGLSALRSADYIGVWDNPNLRNFHGLESLDSLTYDLSITHNDKLKSLDGLNNLRFVGFYIEIGNNDSITSLEGLESIDSSFLQWIRINDNLSLSNCATQAICEFLADPMHIISLENNMEGCNTRVEIEEDCLVDVDNIENFTKVAVYPNPFTTSTAIQYQLAQPETITLTIFNHLGKQVDHIQEYQQPGKQSITWKPQGLLPGMYFFTLKAGEQVATGKMVMVQ